MSSSEPGALPPPPPGQRGRGVGAGPQAVPPPSPPPPPLSTRLASQESTIGARIGSSFLTRAPPAPEPPTAGRPPSRLTTSSSWSPKMWLGDRGAVLLVDRRQVGPARQQVVVVLAERLEDRARTRGVAGVGLQATEQGREHGRGRGAHLVGGGARPAARSGRRAVAPRMSSTADMGSLPSSADRLRLRANLAPGEPGGVCVTGHRGRAGCMIGV